jgi:hypothetical protein
LAIKAAESLLNTLNTLKNLSKKQKLPPSSKKSKAQSSFEALRDITASSGGEVDFKFNGQNEVIEFQMKSGDAIRIREEANLLRTAMKSGLNASETTKQLPTSWGDYSTTSHRYKIETPLAVQHFSLPNVDSDALALIKAFVASLSPEDRTAVLDIVARQLIAQGRNNLGSLVRSAASSADTRS